MKARQLLKRLFKSQWTRIFGPAIIVMEVLAVAASIVTGDWELPWLFPLFLVFFLFRAVLIAFLFLWPVFIAVIIVWAAYTRSKEKHQKKANLEASTRGPTTSSDGAQ